MKLKEYQSSAVEKLLSITKKLLLKENTRVCVLKAPTGSGKTIMVAEWLQRLGYEQLDRQYAFIWISGNNLHKQSKEKLEGYLSESRYTLSYIEDIQGNEFKENEIVFVNWHSLIKQDKKTGAYTNIYMKDNEGDKNLRSFINRTKEEGKEVILIVDESHYHYWSIKSQELVQNVIAPKLILEVSATPTIMPTPDDQANEDAGYVPVKFEDVVSEGMVKKEVVINADVGENTDYLSVVDEVILKSSIKKLEQLRHLYQENDIEIKPLLLVQLPSESESTSTLDETKMEQVVKYLRDSCNITVENGKLGIWLSEEKHNIDNIEKADSDVEVLIFKQAIALGWDCPRAQILVMFREIKNVTFEIQTVGRILRTPEAKHYEILDLDRAYVYTNLEKIAIKEDKDNLALFQVYISHRKPEYSEIKLSSVYLKRVDFGDLTLKFRKLFFEEANNYFGITEKDIPKIAKEKADDKLELEPEELTKAIISDAVFTDIDKQVKQEITGNKVNFTVPEEEIKAKYESFAKLASLPYAPVRSHNKIQVAIYDWFDSYLGYKQNSRLDIQRIVVCSAKNQQVFKEIIDSAKERFKTVRREEINKTERKKSSSWDVPIVEYFNEYYEEQNVPNYVHDKCYLRKDRTEPEKKFEQVLTLSSKVSWWFKNGVDKETYFAVDYSDPKTSLLRAFYPDYIVCFTDGTVGIFDTKSGFTADSDETKAKAESLHNYIQAQIKAGKKLRGGIVQLTKTGLYVFEGGEYNSNTSDERWKRLDF